MRDHPPTPDASDTHGHKTGMWTDPDPHGGVMVGRYVDGRRDGLWRHHSADGRLRSEGTFANGVLHGPWTWYRASGQLMQRGAFHTGRSTAPGRGGARPAR